MSTKLTKSIIEAAQPLDKGYFLNDSEVSGFSVRIHPSGKKTFCFQYRIGRTSRRVSLGDSSVIKVAMARDDARAMAVAVKRGGDPQADRKAKRDAVTVAQLAGRFDEHHIFFNLKESTAREYRRAIRNDILPAIGRKAVTEVTRADIAKIHYDLRHKATQANRTLEIISKMFNYAEEWELRPAGSNPRRGVRKNPEVKRERFLSEAELARVGQVLSEMEAERVEMPSAIAAARLLIFTGCRLNEVMTLKWEHVLLRSGILRLPDSKTGRKDVQLGQPAVELLRSIERRTDNPWVIVGKKPGERLTDLQPFWQRVRARAGLNDVRIHDLRHTFASVAAAAGMSLPMIGKLLGHKTVQSTQRYAHLAAGTVKEAANDVASAIAGNMYSA